MDIHPNDVEIATRLIYFGLDPKETPNRNAEYKDLIHKYSVDSTFQQLVAAIASGLLLKVLGVKEFGIVLCPKKDSLFAFRLSDERLSMKPREREVWGLILFGIAAYVFPKQISFSERGDIEVKTVGIPEIDKYIRSKCKLMLDKFPQQDLPSDSPEMMVRYKYYLDLPQTDSESRLSQSTSVFFVKKVFEFLRDHRLAEEREGGEFALLPRFSMLVQELSQNDDFKAFLNTIAGSGKSA